MNINKITGGVEGSGSRRSVDESPKEAVSGNKEQGNSVDKDSVKLSSQSQSIQQVEAEVNKLPEIDDKTIERIKDQLAKGEYKIDYNRLAGKIIDFEGLIN